MKSSFKIIFKIAVLTVFLCVTPFHAGFRQLFAESTQLMTHLVYHNEPLQQNISIKDRLNVLTYNANITIPQEDITVETTQENPKQVPQEEVAKPEPEVKEEAPAQTPPEEALTSDETTPETPVKEANGKKIYIYNTHQEEGYTGGQSVMDGAVVLGKKLEEKGYKVVLETNDFPAYLKSLGLTYNEGYQASYDFLNEALVNYGGFDLCIDFHRDSIPRESSYVTLDGVTYAKAMMVVGGLSKNAQSANAISSTLTDIVNAKKNGIMKGVMNREAYYNQQVHENVVLMEVGGDVNTFEEVCNTLQIVAEGIDELLMSR